MAIYTTKQRNAVVKRAIQAVEARQNGKTTFTAGGQTFKLGPVYNGKKVIGYCNRFIRQCFETALGFAAFQWRYGATTARGTLDKLEAFKIDGAAIKLQPGDILGWYEGSGVYGHIALYLGDIYGDGRKLVAENTSARRGSPIEPGTKIIQLKSCRSGWQAYRLFPSDDLEAEIAKAK